MTRVIDFDQFRAEQEDEPIDFIIGGKHYPLPSSLPASMAVDVIRMQAEMSEDDDVPTETMDKFGRSLFGDTMWTELLREHRITVTEISPLMEKVLEAYSASPKEMTSETESPLTSETEAPDSASSSTGRASKRTSSESTPST